MAYRWRGAPPRAGYSRASGPQSLNDLRLRIIEPIAQCMLFWRTGRRPFNSRHGAEPRAIRGGMTFFLLVVWDAMFLEPAVECPPAQAQRLGYAADIAFVVCQTLPNHLGFQLVERHGAGGGERRASG